jgi:hypothetical protein
MVAFDWTSAIVGVRKPPFFSRCSYFCVKWHFPIVTSQCSPAFDCFVYVTHHYLFGSATKSYVNWWWLPVGIEYRRGTVTRSSPTGRFRSDASLVYPFSLSVPASIIRGVDLRLRGLKVKRRTPCVITFCWEEFAVLHTQVRLCGVKPEDLCGNHLRPWRSISV